MNQIQVLTSEKLTSDHLEKIWFKRRLYAFTVCSFALFLFLVLSLALTVRQYRSDNDLVFQIDGNSEASVSEFKSTLLQAMQVATSDRQLVKRIEGLHQQQTLRSPHLLKTDLDTLRSKIKVFTNVVPEVGQAHVRVSFFGQGTQDESRFVKRTCEEILEDLRRRELMSINAPLVQVSDHLQEHLQYQDRFSATLKSMISDLDGRLAGMDRQLKEVWDSGDEPVVQTLAERKIQSRRNQLEQLRRREDQLLLANADNDGELGTIQQQIELVSFELKQIQENPSPYGFQRNPTMRGVSYFQNEHAGGNTERELLGRMANEVASIDLSGLVSSIEMIDEHRHGNLKTPIRFLDEMIGDLSEGNTKQSKFQLMEPGVGSMRAVGGKPTTGQVFCFTILALAFGGIVVWQLNPGDIDRGFDDTKSLTTSLGVPVISSFPLQSSRDNKKTNQIPGRVLWICEILVLTIVAVVVMTCLLNADILAALLENPFDGLARIVWLFRKS